jgi:succinate dehydrogenase / fumarate reductase cytochrome b subunit
MNWFTSTIMTSIGKKLLMALTGLSFVGFLSAHLAGNMFIYGGRDAFNSYAEHLHSLGPVITTAEFFLLFLVIIHILTGAVLFYRNLAARPVKYKVYKTGGGRSLGSATMPYTGFIVLAFIVFHLINFHFVDKTNTTIFQIVSNAFANPLYIIIYVFAMITLAVHVSHGFWSLFQTIGFNHSKYTPFIKKLSITICLIFGVGFGFIPIYISMLS